MEHVIRTFSDRSRVAQTGMFAAIALFVLLIIGMFSGETEASVSEPEIMPTLATVLFEAEDYGLPRPMHRQDTTLQTRETLSGLMSRLDIQAGDAHRAMSSLIDAGYIDTRRLRPGLAVSTYTDEDQLTALAIDIEPGRRLLTKRVDGSSFLPVEIKSKLFTTQKVIRGTISNSLYYDGRELGAGDQQVVDFAQVFAYDVDFQRELYPGDQFELVYDVMVDERGEEIRRGDVLYAALKGGAVDKAFYRFTTGDDNVTDYFQYNGESATRFLMKTPINGARLSSSFGRRRHPISGYTRMHKGTDFAAPTGTPIYAAGHGTVERASRNGGYGNYVRIRHANGYQTAYAHLSRYGPGIRSGKRVRQGDVIGYVGSTGASTGPHLHYEVHINGRAVNAMTLKLPTGRKLEMAPEMFAEFQVRRDEIDAARIIPNLPQPGVMAANDLPMATVNAVENH